MTHTLRALFADETGATMVEYGIMIALIAAVCITVISQLGQKVQGAFSTINDTI